MVVYGGDWCTRDVRGAYGVGLWKHIRKGWGVFNRYVQLQLSVGSRIKFWGDVWCGNRALQELYPSLFQIAREKDATVSEIMEIAGGQILWNINFTKEAHDWEISSFADFYGFLYSIRPNRQQEDVMWWTLTGKGTFSVCSFYKALTQVPNTQYPWRKIWRHKALPKFLSLYGLLLWERFLPLII
ncbi:hypothetical protein I3842_12G052100 [Carya illinoinensis]|uniref:Reverse transcriptase zinc-binding domain-containing protein n=1 Tax=Carya illinoinensis TaxID=32201 RepID=A0A922DGZ2_CARIL|nr:hypothetical protein I3842_12G052100 [Carya illinoinensis]